MKKIVALSVFLVFTGWIASCEDPQPLSIYGDQLLGKWVKAGYEDPMTVMVKSSNLKEDEYGFILGLGGRFTERKISGACATPPVQYKNYEGWWEMKNDSILQIEVGYWGGTMKYDLKILFFEGDTLKVQYFYDQ
jgi:hypothetical protein